ncbi:MAG: hypothetical protein ACXWQO_04745 [Bdellovibrionota bacterium]
MKITTLLALLLIPNLSYAEDYCVAIRGNGENAAAHWAGLSRMVEEKGMPVGAAGGSSATISMFFLDSIAGNPAIQGEKDTEKKKQMQALMLKSLPQFVTTMAKADGVMGAYNFVTELAKNKSDLKAAAMETLRGAGSVTPEQFKKGFQKYGPLVNPEMLQGLKANPEYFSKEAKQGLSVFGKFDAGSDDKLFFRPGLVDFKAFSMVLGNIADFYAGNTDPETKAELNKYTDECAGAAFGKAWSELPEDGCKARFQDIVTSYLKKGEYQNKALFNEVGKNIPTLAATSLVHGSGPNGQVVEGDGLREYAKLKMAYNRGEDKDYKDFSLNFSKDVSFGYWGTREDLEKADHGLEADRQAGDLKAQKFKAIGPANWFEVLAVSPAEPGLANFQPIPQNTTRETVLAEWQKPALERWQGLEYRKNIVSAGGWSDLAPVGVLKAMGCPSVTYLTRKGGDTIFGQQVLIKLSGDKENIPWWLNIKDKNEQGWPTIGTKAADTSWNRLSNRGNLHSSLQNSMRKADDFYCTDWDSFNVFGGQMAAMVDEAYKTGLNSRKNEPGCSGIKLGGSASDQDKTDEKPAL